MGKGAGAFSCLQGAAVALFPCSEIQKGARHGVCFLVCASLGFLSFCGELLLDVGFKSLDIAVPAFSNRRFQLYFWQSTAPALKFGANLWFPE